MGSPARPNYSILVANTATLASMDAVKTELDTGLKEAGIQDGQYKMVGESPNKRFIIQMSGNGDAAQRKVRAARRAL